MSLSLSQIFNSDINNSVRLTIKLNENYDSIEGCVNTILSSLEELSSNIFTGGTVSGLTSFSSGLVATTISGGTIYSGSTNLEDIIRSLSISFTGDSFTRVSDGINVFTGGTQENPTINITGAALNNLFVSGDSIFNSFEATSISGGTIYSGETDLSLIFAPISAIGSGFGNFLPISGGTGGPYEFTGSTTASTLNIKNSVDPDLDNNVDIGSPFKRFRQLNVVNGVAVNFTASTKIQLGSRELTEHNTVITGDTIVGGMY